MLREPAVRRPGLDPENIGPHVPEDGTVFEGDLLSLDEERLKAMFDGRPDLV